MRKLERMKNLLSFLLAFCMMLSYVPMPAQAEEGDSCAVTVDCTCMYVEGVCSVCGEAEPEPVPEHTHVYDGEAVYAHKDDNVHAVTRVCTSCEEQPSETVDETHAYAESVCTCGKEEPHVHSYTEGRCECGEECVHVYVEGICSRCELKEFVARMCICSASCGGDNGVNSNCSVCLDDSGNCVQYVPSCTCAEKCTDETLNVYCTVCGVEGMESCTGKEDTVCYVASGTFTAPNETAIMTWEYDGAGTLTISGKGSLNPEGLSPPWLEYRDEIVNLVVNEGVIRIIEPSDHNALESIIIPSTVKSLHFGNNNRPSNLKIITISPDNQWFCSIDNVIFNKRCTKLISYPKGLDATSYQVPDGVEAIERHAFRDCDKLISLTFPDSTVEFGPYAVSDCNNLVQVNIPDGTAKLDMGMFSLCSELESIHIPNSVRSIELQAFFDCGSLRTIHIPASVQTIGEEVLTYCDKLESITVAEDNLYFSSKDNVLFNKNGTTLLRYPSNAVEEEYEIPDGVISIGSGAFQRTENLKRITIPNSVTHIYDAAFVSCARYPDIIFTGAAPTIDDYPIASYATAYYPANNATWTEEFMKRFDKRVSWVPYDPDADEDDELHNTLSELTEADYMAFSAIVYKDLEEAASVKEALMQIKDGDGKSYWDKKWGDSDILYSELCRYIAQWEPFEVCDTRNSNGFFAVSFRNVSDEVVLAIRGSDNIGKVFSDWNSFYDWIENDFPAELFNAVLENNQYVTANDFYRSIASERDASAIVVTGHSLGGGLANILSSRFGCKGVTFNAISILDAMYAHDPQEMAKGFRGIDTWNFVDHANCGDLLAGMYEANLATKVKPYIAHESNISMNPIQQNVPIMDIIACHSMQTYVTKDSDGNVVLRERADRDDAVFLPQNIVSAPSMYSSAGVSSVVVDFATSKKDKINQIWNVFQARTSYGGDSADEITTGIWDDTLIGGKGADKLDGSWGDDIYVYSKGDGTDDITDVGGYDKLYLVGFSAGDLVEVQGEQNADYIEILQNKELIIRIQKKCREYVNNASDRFVVHIERPGEDSYYKEDITDYFKKRNYGSHILIGCPVSIEILDADGNVVYTLHDGVTGNFYTEYGNFYVYEEEVGGYGKVLDLVEGYTVRIVGVDTGTMDIAYQRVENGELSEAKTLSEIPVTRDYKAILEVDERGELLLNSSDDTHTSHSAGSDWFYDETNHWHECTGCENTMDLDAHIGGIATCMARAVCAVCNQSYGVEDAENHTGKTTVTGKKESTCGADGYTGDTVCECGETLTKGEVIPATGKHTGGTATCSEKAICKVCGQPFGEKDPKRHSFTQYNSDYNATCKRNGTKTAKCDYGCGKTDTITDRGSKLGHKFDGDKCIRCGLSRLNPDTGDKIMIAVVVLLVSGTVLLVLASRKRRK